MSLLSQVSKGKIKKPILTIIYGPDGVGKSTFGANAPSPIFLGTEDGTANLDVTRFPKPTDFDSIRAGIRELITEKHDYKTLVIDSLDWLETMVHSAICAKDGSKTINQAQGGYGNGIEVALQSWRALQSDLTELRNTKGMNIILIAHSQVKDFHDPTQNLAYSRFLLKLNDKAAALWREYVDTVLFANFEVVATKEKSEKKAKSFGDGARKLYTERRPSFDAKNRLGLPFELPLDWAAFIAAADSGEPESAEQLLKDIAQLEVGIKNPQTVEAMKKAVANAKNDVSKLVQIKNHAQTIAEL